MRHTIKQTTHSDEALFQLLQFNQAEHEKIETAKVEPSPNIEIQIGTQLKRYSIIKN
jgi:hypothetical protein